jgi:glycosyltransferase involved in cell wall biosynthesis
MPEDLTQLEDKNIINFGEVPDAKKFMENYPIMVAPIFSGGGLKIKIIEAMAMGKIVVCNPEAASGIPATHQQNILFANSSQDFIILINDLFSKIAQPNNIGNNARLLIEENFNDTNKAKELRLFLSQ